jgi:probable phosphoglycerate mutase
MTRILLTRHGETDWNAIGRVQGQLDIALNDAGREQARRLVDLFAGIAIGAVWTSDLARARETAEIVAAALGLPAPHIEAELRERRMGRFEGLTREECAATYPDAWRAKEPPEAEAAEAVIARMTRVLTRIASTEPETVLVIGHGVAMRHWLAQLLGTSLSIENATTFEVEHDGSAFRAWAFERT